MNQVFNLNTCVAELGHWDLHLGLVSLRGIGCGFRRLSSTREAVTLAGTSGATLLRLPIQSKTVGKRRQGMLIGLGLRLWRESLLHDGDQRLEPRIIVERSEQRIVGQPLRDPGRHGSAYDFAQ